MTENKARKRAIRARMTKTGERYTAARRNVVKDPQRPPSTDLGQSDAAIERGSGKSWDEWFAILDAWGATKHTHTEIARYIHDEYAVSGWWTQAVTVGYERGRGLRKPNQRTSGFAVGVSKTFPKPADALFEQFTNTRKRNKWLEAGTLSARSSQPGKTARFDYGDDGSRVHVYFIPKAASKTTVTIEHERLPEEASVDKMRAFWKDRLQAVAELM
jgi:hypothetical protein